MFWLEEKMLVISDAHFGKVTHFRKSGIAIPKQVIQQNWDHLNQLILEFNPKRIVYLGDLFHSEYNSEWQSFKNICTQFPKITQELIIGNHDILDTNIYNEMGLQLYQSLSIGPFLLSHHPEETDAYNIHGHIHPGIVIHGKGRQSVKLSCFYFGNQKAIMPAFGNFTGCVGIKRKKNDNVFAIAENEIFLV